MCDVLLRHLAPRHPPYALSSFNICDTEKLTLFFLYYAMYYFSHLCIQLLRFFRCRPLPCRPAGGLTAQPCFSPREPQAWGVKRIPLLSLALRTNQPGKPPGQKRALACLHYIYSVRAFTFVLLNPALTSLPVEMRGFEPLTSALQRQRSPTELHPLE